MSAPMSAAGKAGGAGGAGGAGTAAAAASPPVNLNLVAAKQLGYVFIVVLFAFQIYMVATKVSKYIRRMSTMNSDKQNFFAEPTPVLSVAKARLIEAPLGSVRLNRNLSLGPINLGTIPARLPALALLALAGVDVYFLLRDLTFPVTLQNVGGLYQRAATLALVNAVPLFFFASRASPFIMLTGIDFNIFIGLHRWIGRMVTALIVVHGAAILIKNGASGGTAAVVGLITKVQYVTQGFIAACGFVLIVLLAGPYIRKPFYETFLFLHQGLVAVSLAFAYLHTQKFWQNSIVIALIGIWAGDRVGRLINIIKNNLGKRGTKILAEALPGDAMRITIYLARPFSVKPGTHLYLYLPSVGLWTSHPFSIAWDEKQIVEVEPDSYEIEKGGLVVSSKAVTETSMSLVVKRRAGMTDSLYKKVEAAGGRYSCRAAVEGPYGGIHGLDSYGTVILFAGGVGITHPVPYLRHLVEGFTKSTVSCRKLLLVWAIPSSDALEWIRPWMTTILAMEGRRDILRIMIYITRPDPRNPAGLDVQSPSASVQMFPGRRPDIGAIIDAELATRIGAMAVSVCGAGELSDSVRAETRKRQAKANLDLFDESFSW